MRTQEMVELIGIAAARRRVAACRRRRGDRDQRVPVRAGPRPRPAGERLLEAGFDEADVDRILELVPLATHNQRGRGTLYVGTEQPMSRAPGRDRRAVDELAGLRAAQAPRRAVRRRARAPAAALRRGLRAPRAGATLERYPDSRRPTSCGRARSTWRRSTPTTWSRSATARSASCAPSSAAAHGRPVTPSSGEWLAAMTQTAGAHRHAGPAPASARPGS